MYKVLWKRRSNGAIIREDSYDDIKEALAEAQEPIIILPEAVDVIVTDGTGAVIFSTAADD